MDRESKAKRAAILLPCIGADAYEIFETLDLSAEDKKDVDRVVKALEDHCIGETNVTYERYLFNQRVQQAGESFDAFFADLKRLIRTCDFGELQDSILRDRIVCGLRDETTRRKLLVTRKLDLKKAIDVCKADETASQQLRTMSKATEQVNVARVSKREGRNRNRKRSQSREWNHDASKSRDGTAASRCTNCSSKYHDDTKRCPAKGQTCRKCGKV